MIAVESGVSTPFPQPDIDNTAILTPCLETQGLRDFLDDPASLDADFDPTVALEELFRYLGDEPPKYGGSVSELGTSVDAPAMPVGPHWRPIMHDMHSSTSPSDDGFDFSSLLDLPQSLPHNISAYPATPDVEMPLSKPVQDPTPPQSPFRQPLSMPPSPMSTSEEDEKSNIPRHKRPAHKRAEVKRRGKIKTKIDDLKEILPLMQNQRKSETVILNRAAEFCRQLKMDMGRHGKEREFLRAEIVALGAEIDNFQKELPAVGIEAGPHDTKTMEERYTEYMRREVKKNWKFWIFSFIARPLFDAYNKSVSTSTMRDFLATIGQWTRNTLGLLNLRSVVMKGVLRISMETDVMANPGRLPQEAMAAVSS
ncbi:carbohydrate-responsive element-binding protein-like [Gigantopelta aegis]|uniref:carbohydrate-responsive element-binding protein-like n=1 Tax=Gigantopelta aegis TaxID=1735272 RepID=UPI001B88B5CE|nr:carbohydrate-responsive element-binding protein-like [Gigantopelta aegis]